MTFGWVRPMTSATVPDATIVPLFKISALAHALDLHQGMTAQDRLGVARRLPDGRQQPPPTAGIQLMQGPSKTTCIVWDQREADMKWA
jgi:hypothetical protein